MVKSLGEFKVLVPDYVNDGLCWIHQAVAESVLVCIMNYVEYIKAVAESVIDLHFACSE